MGLLEKWIYSIYINKGFYPGWERIDEAKSSTKLIQEAGSYRDQTNCMQELTTTLHSKTELGDLSRCFTQRIQELLSLKYKTKRSR